MQRDEHRFQFSADKIAEAAKKEEDYCEDRILYWEKRQQAAAVEAAKSTVHVKEIAVTGGKSYEIVIDQTPARELSRCADKLRDHRKRADQFRIEAATYASQKERVYDLDPVQQIVDPF